MYTNPSVDSGFYLSVVGPVLAEAHAPTQQPTGNTYQVHVLDSLLTFDVKNQTKTVLFMDNRIQTCCWASYWKWKKKRHSFTGTVNSLYFVSS